MRIRYYFTIFCVLVVFGLLIACRRGETKVSARLDTTEINLPAFGQEEEDHSKQMILVLDLEDEQDLILVSYKDPAFHEAVLAFFADMTGSRDVAEVVLSNAAANDISPALAFALCAEESAYNLRAFNRNRNDTVDRGLFQLNSASFPKLDVEEFYDPGINARYGLSHLRWCLNTAGTEVAALAMYNAGSTRVHSAGTPKQTLDYVSRILNRQRRIEGLFMAEYVRIMREGSGDLNNSEKPAKTPLRLSLLTPLGERSAR